MYYVADKQKALRALTELRTARTEPKEQALACLQRLRNEVAGALAGDRARMDAWVSIRRLYDAVKSAPDGDLKPLWQDAIVKTAAWQESLR